MRLGMRMGLNSRLSGGGNPDGLALDLAFALDRSFTTDPAAAGNALITSRRGPAAKFSRGSGATQVNAAGLIEYAPENLILRSEEFNEISWAKLNNSSGAVPVVTPNAVLSPTGTLTADLVAFPAVPVGENPRLEQNRSSIAGSSFVFSFWIRSDSPTTVRVGHLTPSITVSATTEWVRVSYAFTFTSGGFPQIVGPISGAASNVYLWGAQLERASTARTYYPTTSAAFHGPRFDHDPATGDCKGLLIEEPRTNLCLRSEEFDNVVWLKPAGGTVASPVVTADQASSPANTQTADRIVFPAISTAPHYTIVTQLFTQSAGISHVGSVYLRGASGGEKVWIMWTPNGTTYSRKECLLTTAWQRFDIAYTSVSGQNFFQIGVDLRDASQSAQPAQTIYAWGAQLEAGALPTSYIPTTSGTAIRSADVCSIIGDDFSSFYSQSEGTLFADTTPQTVDQGALVVGTATTTFQNGHFIYKTNGTVTANGKRWGVTTTFGATPQSVIATTTDIAIAQSKLSYAYKLNDMTFAANGALIGTDNTGTMPTSTTFRIGARDDGAYLNGHIARIQYFRKRLSNAKLQTLTAP